MTQSIKKIILFLGIAIGLLYFGVNSFQDKSTTEWYFAYLSYYLIFALMIVWTTKLLSFLLNRQSPLKKHFTHFKWEYLGCLVLAGIIFLSVPPHFRILSDETNLLAVSKAFFEDRIPRNIIMQSNYAMFLSDPLFSFIPRRPLLFPFSLHLFHVLLGYHTWNSFVLNFFTLTSSLCLVYFFFRRSFGVTGGITAIFLLCSQPVFIQSSTSGGFELFFCFFILLSFGMLLQLLQKPSNRLFQLLCLTLIMTAHIRYESILLIPLFILFLLFSGYFRNSPPKLSYLYLAIPLFLLPLFWQQTVARPPYEESIFEDKTIFAISHFIQHFSEWLQAMFSFSYRYPYAAITNCLGLLGFYFIYTRFKEGTLEKRTCQGISFFFLLWGALTGLYLSFNYGNPTLVTNTRLFVFTTVGVTFLGTYGLLECQKHFKRRFLGPVVAILIFCFYHPFSIQNLFARDFYRATQYQKSIDFLKELPQQQIMIISDRPGHFTVHNYGAVDFKHANLNSETIWSNLKNHLYQDIFVFQEINYSNHLPTEQCLLKPEYKTTPITQWQATPKTYVRISKLLPPNS